MKLEGHLQSICIYPQNTFLISSATQTHSAIKETSKILSARRTETQHSLNNSPPLHPGNHHSTFCLYEPVSFSSITEVEAHHVCLL